MFLYLFNLFKGSFIIVVSYDDFQYSSIISFIIVEIKVNLKFIQIVVISENSHNGII